MANWQILFAHIFVGNVVLAHFLGLCPLFGVAKSMAGGLGMGAAVTFVLTLACMLSSTLYYYALLPLGLQFLKLLVFVFVIAALVQLVEMVIRRLSPNLHKVMGVYLPLISSNCAVLGVALWNVDVYQYDVLQSTVAGFAGGLGFSLVSLLMAGIRLRLQLEGRVPRALRGTPIAFISAGLIALAFYAF